VGRCKVTSCLSHGMCFALSRRASSRMVARSGGMRPRHPHRKARGGHLGSVTGLPQNTLACWPCAIQPFLASESAMVVDQWARNPQEAMNAQASWRGALSRNDPDCGRKPRHRGCCLGYIFRDLHPKFPHRASRRRGGACLRCGRLRLQHLANSQDRLSPFDCVAEQIPSPNVELPCPCARPVGGVRIWLTMEVTMRPISKVLGSLGCLGGLHPAACGR